MKKIEIERTKAIIEPSDIIRKKIAFPEIGVSCFSLNLIKKTAERYGGERIGSLITVAGRVPIYKIICNDAVSQKMLPIALIPAAIGAPACAAVFEEVIAMGLKKLVQFGSCGLLVPDIPEGTMIIPTAAIREEGTSYHYLPPSEEIEVGAEAIDLLEGIFEAKGVRYIKGKTWTTDAVYRETYEKADRYKETGAVCVEMECAAMLAVAAYREVEFVPFFFCADSLAGKAWDPRNLGSPELHNDERAMLLALAAAVAEKK